jgi:hypothetical protein
VRGPLCRAWHPVGVAGACAARAARRAQQDRCRTSHTCTNCALTQGFAALRAISEQLYLEQCSSSSSEEGVQVRTWGRRLGRASLYGRPCLHSMHPLGCGAALSCSVAM